MIKLNDIEDNILDSNEVDLRRANFTKSQSEILFEDAKRTVPIGVEILENKLNRTSIKLKYGKLSLVIFRMYVPKEKEMSLKLWVEDFKRRFDTNVIIQREQGYSGISSLFSKYFKGKDLLVTSDIPIIEIIKNNYFGRPPKISESFISLRKKLNSKISSLEHIPFVAIDSKGTIDPEDAVYIERKPNGNFILTVAIADISYLVLPRGKQKDYALNIGSTIYGTKERISTLGDLISFEESHLSNKEPSPAWIFTFDISKDRKAKLLHDPYLAFVKIHEQISPEDIDSGNNQSEFIQNLSIASKILRYTREGIYEGQDLNAFFDANSIISEIIIKTKETFANFLNKHKSKKAIFKVQRTLSLNKKREILKNLKKVGLYATIDMFKYPEYLSKVLSDLQDICFKARIYSIQKMLEAQKILNDIINVFFKRSYYDSTNRGHAYLNVTSYCDIKGRLAAGIINQIQARNILYSFDKSYSKIEIDKMIKKLNRQIRTYGIKYYTLHFLEMLEDKLSYVGKEFTGDIKRIKEDNLFLEIDGFKKWGVIPLSKIEDEKLLNKIKEYLSSETSFSLKIRLLGYSLKEQRFLFEIG